jgi:Zn-dependent protease
MTFLNPAYIISILIALSVHEWAHAYSAAKLGDPTAFNEGRVTVNPLAHLDPLGTLMFIFVGFGWGKPVPVNPRYFSNEKRDTAIVAAAGPISNLVLSLIAYSGLIAIGTSVPDQAFGLLSSGTQASIIGFIVQVLQASVFLNLALMAFNLLPIAPLDGSKVVRLFIPYQYEDKYYDFMLRGPYILLGILVLENITSIRLLSTWVFGIINPILSMYGSVAGMFM